MNNKVRLGAAAALLCAASWAGAQTAAAAPAPLPPLTPEQQRFHDIYKELVEINTTHLSGNNTEAAQAMRKHLLDAGFKADEIQLFEPYPNKGNLVVRYKGTGAKKPLLLLAHIDVVEARRSDWKTDPFKLKEDDGYFTARGSSDDKAMAASFVSILSQLKREGFKPNRDIVLALTADEELGDVPTNGAFWLVNNQRALLDAEFGINEGGGGQLNNGKPVLHRVQVAEKMYTTYKLEVRDVGGHSSLPTPGNPVYELGTALERLGKYRFPVKLADVTQKYFERSAQFETGQMAEDMRAVAAGKPDEAATDRLSKSALYNATLRTTCVATQVTAGHAENALPQSAKATVNCRILPHDDPAEVDAALRKLLETPRMKVEQTNPPLKSPPSPLRPEVMQVVDSITQQMWPGIPVVPTMSTGATDSRFMRNIGIPMYGVSGIFSEPSDARAHGLDERVAIPRLYDGREFMYRMVKQFAQ
ncbi:Acetylornithine deacetylase/Succinyl-diaminopimelate desuccinylase [Variovorax sp. HW608]|uniref:M20/M25/M40 family metallo-hydrolase n=1 Tax=Variovorax sp. HW608 TaxID=1034889 RepID=UPI00081FDFD9|nr:M20/M25/M40 family metallo-hydrolase [Variovorax sp. HW608]SCK16093.1 Acetylornithine deacetylase/Succinyl-diaminopimelate desuccinylase [Variovorax sp. HW608]